jgi:hypothetical protein
MRAEALFPSRLRGYLQSHQGIEQQIPGWHEQDYPFATTGPVIATPVLNGLHHAYSRAAYLH